MIPFPHPPGTPTTLPEDSRGADRTRPRLPCPMCASVVTLSAVHFTLPDLAAKSAETVPDLPLLDHRGSPVAGPPKRNLGVKQISAGVTLVALDSRNNVLTLNEARPNSGASYWGQATFVSASTGDHSVYTMNPTPQADGRWYNEIFDHQQVYHWWNGTFSYTASDTWGWSW